MKHQRYLASFTSSHMWPYLTPSTLFHKQRFSDNLIHYEERAKSYPENIPNLTNPLDSKIYAVNDNFILKEATSKTESMEFVEEMRR